MNIKLSYSTDTDVQYEKNGYIFLGVCLDQNRKEAHVWLIREGGSKAGLFNPKFSYEIPF